MKKSKRTRRQAEASVQAAAAPPRKVVWWPWAAGGGALLLALWIYSPALHGPFVLDDRNLPFYIPGYDRVPLWSWIKGTRPVLYLTFWLNFQAGGDEPFGYHFTNVILHVLTAALAGLIAARLLKWAGMKDGRSRPALGAFAGALFLVHPLQTEAVAYVASRSDVLSTLFYYGAYCVFLYRRGESISWLRALAVLALGGAAVLSKQPALSLPLLLLLTDLYWSKGGLRANRILYAMLALAGIAGGIFVWKGLSGATTVLHVQGMTPATYFFTECRVVWTYVRLFFLPFGQNADPDVAISQGLLDHGAIFFLAAWIAVAAAAWLYRARWPLACFGVLMFLLLVGPSSSIIPVADVLQERRLYLPFLGLTLVCLEFLRRLELRRRMMVEVPVLLALCALTWQRSSLWGDPVALWQDSAAKSPAKFRPRFQLAYAYFERDQYDRAAQNFEAVSHLGPPDYGLLVDWGLTLDRLGRRDEAAGKLRLATALEVNPQAWGLLGQVYGEQGRVQDALQMLQKAESIDPKFAMTYAIRGNVYEVMRAYAAAAQQYRQALALEPSYTAARDGLLRVQGK